MGLKEEIAHRIEKFFKSTGLQKQEFARILGIAPQHVNKIFSADLDPLKYINMLADNLGADKKWLLTGIKDFPDVSGSFRTYVKEPSTPEYSNKNSLEYKLESTIPAGDGELVDLTDWCHSAVIDYSPQTHFFLKVDEQFGSSMMPLIKPGDLVLCSLKQKIKNGDIVAAKWDRGKGALKIATFAKNDNKNVILMSYNQAYEPFSVPIATTKMFKVVLIKKN